MSGDAYPISLDRDVPARMRDGVVLRADVYRPDTEGRFPVLIHRTPYNKATTVANGIPFAIRAACRGYVVILQDCRGRYASEGEWYPFLHEMEDGYDTVEWAAALPYSTGQIGMFGWSYAGVTQLFAALAQPEHLVALFPVLTPSDYHAGWTYRGGAFQQFFNESWAGLKLSPDTLNRRVVKSANAMNWVWKLPLADFPLFETGGIQELAPYFFDWLQHPAYDEYWKRWSVAERHDRIKVPACHVAGWYDIFVGGSIDNYVGIRARGGTRDASRGQRLVIGPWYHDPANFRSAKTGQVDFGQDARFNEEDLMFRWFDWLLKGVPTGLEGEKPIKIFVMGKNVWREEDEWPLARAEATRYYLHSGGRANTSHGDGTLGTQMPRQEPADKFVYDPADPVLTRGGGNCCDHEHLAPGAFDQRPTETRQDVLVYTTPVLTEDLEVTGPVRLELYVSSSAVDTDFTGKLVDVWPDGFAQNLTDGILRMRFRNSFERAELMNPGETYQVEIDLWATSNVFLAGHRLRLEVSSSSFPRFDRNLNTGECPAQATRMVKAVNTVHHDDSHPSALILPVVPRQP